MEQKYEKTIQLGLTPYVFRVYRRHGQTHRLEIAHVMPDCPTAKVIVCEEDIGAFVAEVCAAAQSLGVEAQARPKQTRGEHLAKVRQKYPRAYEPWTPDEEAQLRAELDEGLSTAEIARRHGRNCGAIESRQEKLAALSNPGL